MKIGIIGSGNIGGTLGRHWDHVGHEVMFTSRNPEELKPMAKEVGAKTGTNHSLQAIFKCFISSQGKIILPLQVSSS